MIHHIELLGLPGSGKSTAYRMLLAHCTRKRIHIHTLHEAAYHALQSCDQTRYVKILARMLPYRIGYRLVGRFPKTVDDVLYQKFQKFVGERPQLAAVIQRWQAQSSEHPQDLGLLVFLWFFELFSSYQLVSDHIKAHVPVVIDEGFCNRALTLFAYHSHISRSELERYIEHIPLPQLVLYVDTSPAIAETRLQSRGYPIRMHAMSSDQKIRFMKRMASCVDTICQQLSQKHVDVLHISNDCSEEDLSRKVHDILERLVLWDRSVEEC